MLSEVIGTVEFFRIITFTKFMQAGEVVDPSIPITSSGPSGKIRATGNNQVHVGEFHSVHRALLRWKCTDLVRSNNVLLSFFLA